ncbi:glycosyltransferase family 4 protein [Cohnella sp. GCM10027633]|uniref:glycosyltransferase family 4 protein n=1 Tax=unclassified Cohnella TaxID=2636738 RepID=UPI00362F71BB
MKVAIVHDWLVVYAGAEKVLEQLLILYPDADLFSIVDFLPPAEREFIRHKPVRTSFIQRLPLSRSKFRLYLVLMPYAVERFDLSEYDLVLSSSYAVAKGVITGPGQIHISYVHTPIRYAWDMHHRYLKEHGLTRGFRGAVATWMLHRIRQWDARTANGVDSVIANSRYVANRIWKVYRRHSTVIHPPVDIDSFKLETNKQDYYLTASRLVPYKRIDLIVEAFSKMPDKRLVVIGDGPEYAKIKSMAAPNVTLLGYQPSEQLVRHMQQARAFLFAAEEDFGIIPVEAQSCGTPVIAYGKGGALETVRGLEQDRPTGVFFKHQSVASIMEAIGEFEDNEYRIAYEECRANALRFSADIFRQRILQHVQEQIGRAASVRDGVEHR